MIECENCILEKAVYTCEVDCLALEDALREHDKQIRAEVIEECKEILLSAMAKDGKAKCHIYMVAINEMEQLKEENKCLQN